MTSLFRSLDADKIPPLEWTNHHLQKSVPPPSRIGFLVEDPDLAGIVLMLLNKVL